MKNVQQPRIQSNKMQKQLQSDKTETNKPEVSHEVRDIRSYDHR